ncbi:MAG: hypothetical protein IPK50_11215 [Fibrobacterota bacterium]|nr:MAG: hypothetical protein IPK50_11215 [Fibrobacterota bacterium]
MVVIRWTVNLLVVAALALVMRHASVMNQMGNPPCAWKSGILRSLASRP